MKGFVQIKVGLATIALALLNQVASPNLEAGENDAASYIAQTSQSPPCSRTVQIELKPDQLASVCIPERWRANQRTYGSASTYVFSGSPAIVTVVVSRNQQPKTDVHGRVSNLIEDAQSRDFPVTFTDVRREIARPNEHGKVFVRVFGKLFGDDSVQPVLETGYITSNCWSISIDVWYSQEFDLDVVGNFVNHVISAVSLPKATQ